SPVGPAVLRTPRPPTSPLSPYTTLFRSERPPREHPAAQDARRQRLPRGRRGHRAVEPARRRPAGRHAELRRAGRREARPARRSSDRKSTRLNSSHVKISYAVFCLKKKKK